MDDNAVIGIDLGGTKLAGGIFNSTGILKHRETWFLENQEGSSVGESVIGLIKHLLFLSKQQSQQIRGVGVAVPGIYYSAEGTVWAPNIPGWDRYPLLRELTTTMGKDIQVSIDSDRACYMLGERWKGAAVDVKDAIFLAVGTGIGAGILVDGKILRGSNDIAGAIGWLALTDPFIDEYASYGCFEFHASGAGIARAATRVQQEKDLQSSLNKDTEVRLTAQEVFQAYDQGDPVALEVINHSIKFWGKAVANLVSLFNPEKIIFGGGVFGPGVKFLEQIYQESKKWAQPISIEQVKLEASVLAGDAGLFGAGYLALQKNKALDD